MSQRDEETYSVGQRINAFFRRVRALNTVISIVLIVLGAMLLISPVTILLVVCRIVGATLLGYGIFLLISALTRPEESGSTVKTIIAIISVALIAVGLFIVIRPGTIVDFTSILFAFILMAFGIEHLISLHTLRTYEDKQWYIGLIGALLTFGLGVLVLVNPFATASLAIRLAGGALIYAGINGLVFNGRSIYVYRQFRKNTMKSEEDDIIDADAKVIDDDEESDSDTDWE